MVHGGNCLGDALESFEGAKTLGACNIDHTEISHVGLRSFWKPPNSCRQKVESEVLCYSTNQSLIGDSQLTKNLYCLIEESVLFRWELIC